MTTISKKGFTLVELLIVIGILAVLATTAVVILNPAQLLAQARDSQRLSDLGSINSALALYQTDIASPDLNGPTQANGTLCSSTRASATSYNVVAYTTASFTAVVPAGGTRPLVAGSRATDETGWLPVKFTDVSSGTPLSTLPIDPINTTATDYIYRYACNQLTAGSFSGTYELNAKLESLKYNGASPNLDLDGLDGGNNTDFYEIGTEPGLDL